MPVTADIVNRHSQPPRRASAVAHRSRRGRRQRRPRRCVLRRGGRGLRSLLSHEIVPHARAEEDVLYAAADEPLRPLPSPRLASSWVCRAQRGPSASHS